MTNKSKYIMTFVFLAFIGIFAVLFWIVPKNDFSPKEKRYLQDFPDVSSKSIFDGTFESEYEHYIDDHMVLRDVFMGVNSYSNLAMLKNGTDGVYYSRDGYLINAPAKDSRLNLNLSVVADFKNKTKIDTTLMIVPSTGYIMENYTYGYTEKYNDDEYFDRIRKSCEENNLAMVDLRESFKDEHSINQLYYKTDHHWTTYGAFLGYRNLCKAWGIKSRDYTNFEVESYDNFYGTTYNTSGFWLNEGDTLEIWKNKNNKSTCEITVDNNTKKYNSMYFYDNLKGEDKYEVFLDGNHPVTTVKNPANKNGEKLLVIKDSFSHCLTPFLSENFSQVTLVDMRYYKKSVSEEICKSTKFDKVLICMSMDNFVEDKDFGFLE